MLLNAGSLASILLGMLDMFIVAQLYVVLTCMFGRLVTKHSASLHLALWLLKNYKKCRQVFSSSVFRQWWEVTSIYNKSLPAVLGRMGKKLYFKGALNSATSVSK